LFNDDNRVTGPGENLPALIDRAWRRLQEARTSGEVLEARKIAQAALHYAKVTRAANETHADCLRIITRAEMRMVGAVDEGRSSGDLMGHGGDRRSFNVRAADLEDIGVDRRRLDEWRDLRDAGQDAVDAAIDAQLAEGRAPTKAGIQAALAGLTANNEWYTPPEWIERARAAMGSIDCDPASAAFAQQTIRAREWFDKERDGLIHPWRGNVWLNPPYARRQIELFIEKLIAERPRFTQAIVLTDNRTDTLWFRDLCSISRIAAFTTGRIGFYNEAVPQSSPANGSVFMYIGDRAEQFSEEFADVCILAELCRGKGAS
jgi:ParB family chromosome partitioning protein